MVKFDFVQKVERLLSHLVIAMYGHFPDFFVQSLRTVCLFNWKMIRASGITGVASHGKHTRATEHVKKLGNKIKQNFVPQFFHMFGDSVYAYYDNATRKNLHSCLLPGS